MVGGTTHQQQQQAPVNPSPATSSTAPATSPEEDEILKRNTDCVYFLASPLTCKKGSECEYRHSEVARVNPRDCWYWLNGNCLNPKCAFRHPPLDGLLGADASTPVGPPVTAPHATPYAMPKQGVACIFFQKGFCLKGHLCPFLHGPPNSVNNKHAQHGSANPVPDPPKMAHSGPNKSVQDQKLAQQATIQKVAPFNGGVDKKVVAPPTRVVEEPPRYKPARVPPVMTEPPSIKPNRGVNHGYHVSENDRVLNGKDADEYSREPSPGFDVLVDNEPEDSEYYPEEGEFGRSRGQDYDVDRVDHVDRGTYREHRDYDNYNERDGQYVWGEAREERRPYPRSDSPDHFNGSDLRHRISKQRRGSDHGSRSAVSRDNHADRMPRRDSHHHRRPDHRPDQGTLSSRLRGRIKIPGRSMSPVKENNPRAEREIDIERKHLSRYSPGRPLSINQSRVVRDRINGNDTMFAGPKRLSELKTGRPDPSKDEQFIGKRKYPVMEDSSSFEGPKPLSEILKRKRGVDNNKYNVNNHISSVNTEENNQKEKEDEHKSVSVDFEAEIEKDVPPPAASADDVKSVNYAENEGDPIDDEDALLDEELEAYDDDEQRDGDYDYEQMDGEEEVEDYNLDEGEYVDEEDVDGDGDEYEKKESVVYS